MKFKFVERVIPPVKNQKLVEAKDKEKKSEINTPKKTQANTSTSHGEDKPKTDDPVSLGSLTQVLNTSTTTVQVNNPSDTPITSNTGENSQTIDSDKKLDKQTDKNTVPTTTNTEQKPISIERRNLKGSTKPINFEFEVSPDQLNWNKSGELSVSPTFMTNEQPVIYSRATQAILTMNSILFDAVHFPNKTDVLGDVTNLERLLSVDADNFSPRVYDVFAETRKYGTFVISSLKINEIRRTIEGKPNRVVADLVLQPIPSYQLRTSQDLAMIPEILPEITVPTSSNATGAAGSVASAGGCLIEKGTVIAYTGSTGRSTGVHIHLEVRPDGKNVTDPRIYSDTFAVSGKPLSTYITNTDGSNYLGRAGKHKGQDYSTGMVGGMPITSNTDGMKLTFSGNDANGWGLYFKCVVNGVELLIGHCSKINNELFKCDTASKASFNSGNKGGNVDPNSAKSNATNSDTKL
ncbi:MAG: M23 family metallopeptidase [Waterburya sp.]